MAWSGGLAIGVSRILCEGASVEPGARGGASVAVLHRGRVPLARKETARGRRNFTSTAILSSALGGKRSFQAFEGGVAGRQAWSGRASMRARVPACVRPARFSEKLVTLMKQNDPRNSSRC
jgi:hypothetical protein